MSNKYYKQIRIGTSGPKVIGGMKTDNSANEDLVKQDHSISIKKGKTKKGHSKKYKDKTIRVINKIDKFNLLVEENKSSGKPWYHGLDGNWWWGMTEEDARHRLIDIEQVFEKNPKIAVASIIRNEERGGGLKRFLRCCHQLEKNHKNIIYIFIEGDSADNTYSILKDWLEPKRDYILKKLDRKYPRFPKNRSPRRTVYFAELRNMLIDFALSIPEVSEILMIDANYGWKGDLISSLRDTDADVSAPLVVMHKNRDGKYLFYDTWAFRQNGKQFSTFYPYIQGLGANPLEIDSVGGGYLIKRRVLEEGIRYIGDKDCEHVGFCQMAKDNGFSIKINPKIYIRKGGYEE